MHGLSIACHLQFEVKHRYPAPKSIPGNIFREREALPVGDPYNWFRSWEEASQAGKKELKKLSAQHYTVTFRPMVGLPIQTFDDTGKHDEILLSLQRYVKFNPTAPGDGTRDVEACVDLRRTCAKLAHCQAFFIGAVAVLLSVSLILRLLALGIRTPNEQNAPIQGWQRGDPHKWCPEFPFTRGPTRHPTSFPDASTVLYHERSTRG